MGILHLVFSILEYIDSTNLSNYQFKKFILDREQFYIDLLEPESNILKIAGSSLGLKQMEETLAKRSGENSPMFGGGTDKDRPKFGYISGMEVGITDLETKRITTYTSIRQAAKAINSHIGTIFRREKPQLEKDGKTPYRN